MEKVKIIEMLEEAKDMFEVMDSMSQINEWSQMVEAMKEAIKIIREK